MSKETDAWMPFYPTDYLRDTQHLETIEHGAYFLLLIYAWTHDARLPLEESRIARVANLSPKEWRKSRDVLLKFFQRDKDGFTHKRVQQELTRATTILEQRQAAGRAAGLASAEARRQRKANDGATNGSTGVERDVERNSTPSPSPSSSLRSEDVDDDARDALAPGDWPADLVGITNELARVAGVAHTQPGHITANMAVARAWIDSGLDPPTEIVPAIRQALVGTGDRIHSLKYFDVPVRQAKARKEAAANGHQPAAKDRWAGYLDETAEADRQPGCEVSEGSGHVH